MSANLSTGLVRLSVVLTAMLSAGTSFALAKTPATPVSAIVAQASPTPKATSNPFAFGGFVRAYDFTRQNASNSAQGGSRGSTNQQSFNLGVSLHGEYDFANSPFSAGASYLYANPLGACSQASDHAKGLPCVSNRPPSTNPDDTLPGFALSTLYEAYLQYKAAGFYGKVGNQIINTPWANASDGRIKPAAFQGADFSYALNRHFTIEAADYIGWEDRTSSVFDQSTLLTSYPAGSPGIPANTLAPGGRTISTSGFFYGRLGYTGARNLTANAYYYGMQNIANLLWFDARYPFSGGRLNPFVALQFGSENSTGSAVIGRINSTVFGLQGGVNVTPNVLVTLGYDGIPVKSDTIRLPTGYTCKGNIIAGAATMTTGSLPYLLPFGGTGNCTANGDGTTNIYYGGWASPYTDSYISDPLFTTSTTQGMVDRRSPGTGFKMQVTFTSSDKHFVGYVSRAWYNYGNPAFAQLTAETDFDALYRLGKIEQGTYHGFLLHYRYGERTQTRAGLPLFKYNRFQVEYDF